MPRTKLPLSDFVTSEDDLGPEIILNLKWLDAYRYPQKTVYFYLELLQHSREINSWSKILSSSNFEEAIDPSIPHEGANFDKYLRTDFSNEIIEDDYDHFATIIRQGPYLISLINQLLTECKFSSETENHISEYARLLMSQPLPHGLMPMETHRIL